MSRAMPSAEDWVRIAQNPAYIVSSLGRIRRFSVGSPILTGDTDADGYRRVKLGRGRHYRVARLVCAAFHGPCPEGHECAHLDGDRSNDAATNLAWASPAENNAHKQLHGTHQAGARHPRVKLTPEQVETIRTVATSTRKLAAEFGVNQSTIARIRKGDRW